MLFLVLQQKNWLQARLNDIRNQGNILEFPPKFNLEEVDLTRIGTLNYDENSLYWLDMILESIWKNCQNDYEYLSSLSNSTNPKNEVHYYWRKPCRSLDVGDLIQLEDHRLFRVESCGFKEIKQTPIIHISQTISNQKLVPYFPTLSQNYFRDLVTERLIIPQGTNSIVYCLETCQNQQTKFEYQRLS